MKKFLIFMGVLLLAGFTTIAQQTITGRVTNAETGEPIPGTSVVVKGRTSIGTSTNMDGEYTLEVPDFARTLIYSFVGMQTQEVSIEGRTTIDVQLQPAVEEMEEVVVTAMGITREKKSLGYSVQEVGGEDLAQSKQTNPLNSLSGKIAGVNIKQSNTMGGSVNMLIRGTTSLTGNNQPLFVVDGVPIDNSNVNTSDQQNNWGGYDYGNAAMDINPEDIKSISVLKGSAATALYGSRAARGVVLITTKKGEGVKGAIGVTINSSLSVSSVYEPTLPQFQEKYGAGYGKYFIEADITGDGNNETIVPTMDDASFGMPYEGQQVVHWDALFPTEDNFAETRPWEFPKNGIEYFFRNGIKYNNNIAFSGGVENASFRLSYTNMEEEGVLPNSSISKHNINFHGSLNLTEALSVTASVKYLHNEATGRFGTGYDGRNPMQSFTQWFETNVDFKRLENYKTADGSQKTWNINNPTNPNAAGALRPAYFNNPYWIRNMMFEDDGRDRVYGNIEFTYDLLDWLSLVGRFGMDHYNWFRRERIAVGSLETSDFTKRTRDYMETNNQIHLKFNKDVGDFNFNGLVGGNMLRITREDFNGSTVGGLVVPGLYNVANSISPVSVSEALVERGKNSLFGNLSIGYRDFIYLEMSGRNDVSSTLPEDNNSYFYPSISTSLIFSELLDADFLSFGKLRLNYAEVGNDAPAYSLSSTYQQGTNWGDLPLYSVNSTQQNPDLKPENTKSYEAGLEMYFLDRRVGFDLAVYQNSTFNQIMPVNITDATGVQSKYVNGGELQNRGIELNLTGSPVKSDDFSWDINLNWAKNENEVVKLARGVDNYLLYSNWGISVNATEGKPYGTFRGTDYVYTNGKRTVYPVGSGLDGRLQQSEEKVIGHIQPDWNAGLSNTFRYKNLALNVLLDMQQGGDIYSISTQYGRATGLYEETAGKNPRGGNIRDPLDQDGGYLYQNSVYPNGDPNESYIETTGFTGAFWYRYIPHTHYLFDASYIKLREVSLSYTLPQRWLNRTPFASLKVAVVGHNLAMLDSNTPFFDPEAITSSGNLQGIENASYPMTSTITFNLTAGF